MLAARYLNFPEFLYIFLDNAVFIIAKKIFLINDKVLFDITQYPASFANRYLKTFYMIVIYGYLYIIRYSSNNHN